MTLNIKIKMKYKISYENPTSQYIPIEATIDAIGKNEIELQFPTWRPGRYELGNFVKNIHGFIVLNEKGKSLQFKKTSKDSWLIECNNTETILIKYKYYAAELNAGSTFMDDLQLFVNPVNCLVYVKDYQDNPCSLELIIPENFKLACAAPYEQNIIKTLSYHELVDSPFIASSTLQHDSFELKGVLFHLWFQGEVNIDFEKVKEDFIKYSRSQIEKYGEFPVSEYHYFYQILPIKAYHGVEHQTSTVISLGPNYDLSNSLYDDFLGVSSHELYHTWNVKAIRPIEMFPYDYSKENYSNLGFVAEGVTTYMGDLFLCESGVKDFSWYRLEIEKLLQRHFDNFGRFNYSVAESSWDTWIDGYVQGAPNRKVSIYNEGALLSFVSDIKIRNTTKNKASLHDVMYKLYHEKAKKNQGYSEEDFKKLVEEISGENHDKYFQNYYYGTHSFEPILVEAFESIGLEIKMKENPSFGQRILGIKSILSNDNTIIKQIYPGSSSDLGGLMIDDQIISINNKKVLNNIDQWTEFYEGSQLEIIVNRMGRILHLICPNTNKSYFPIYEIVKAKNTSNLSKRIFKKWCGQNWDEID